MQELFFELLRVAVGQMDCLSRGPSSLEWNDIYQTAQQHGVPQQMGQTPMPGSQQFAVNNGGFIPLQNNPYAPPVSAENVKKTAPEHDSDMRTAAPTEKPEKESPPERENKTVEKTDGAVSDKKICPNCNAELAASAKFCKVCGTPQK